MGDFFQPNGLMSENKFWNGVKGVQTQGSTSIAFLLPRGTGISALKVVQTPGPRWSQTLAPSRPLHACTHVRHVHTCARAYVQCARVISRAQALTLTRSDGEDPGL